MKIEKLTPEQEALIPVVRQEWLDKIFKCDQPLDRGLATKQIKWLYKLSKQEEPLIVFVSSPLAAQYAVHYTKEFLTILKKEPKAQNKNVWAQVGDQVRAQVRAQVGDQVRDQVGDQVWEQVRDQVGAQVRDQVWEQVGEQVRAQVWEQVRDQVGAQVGDQVWEQKLEFESFCSYGSVADFNWLSFIEFFRRANINVKLEAYDEFKSLIDSGIYDMIQLQGLCVVCERPISIKRDEENRLHSLEGSCVKWSDGWSVYSIHGRRISEKYFHDILNKTFTVEDLFKEQNEEIKSACLQMITEVHGENYLAQLLSSVLKEINTYVDKKEDKYLEGTTRGMNVGVYTLFVGEIQGYKIAYIRCYCASTDRMFYLGVEPGFRNAKDAIASLYNIPSKLKPYIKSISRQGERFSTTFTEEGLSLVKKLSETDLNNMSSISGEEYFQKMKYEF